MLVEEPFDPFDEVNRAFWRRWFANADFDPVTTTFGAMASAAGIGSASAATGATMGVQGVGPGISAFSSIIGGGYAKAAGQAQQAEANYEAEQLEENATQAVAASQRRMMNTQLKTNLAISSERANAAFGGVEASTGSPLTNQKTTASRGAYEAGLDLYNGMNTATGLQNAAQGKIYGGEIAEMGGTMQQTAGDIAAGSSIIGGFGNQLKTYAAFAFPPLSGGATPNLGGAQG